MTIFSAPMTVFDPACLSLIRRAKLEGGPGPMALLGLAALDPASGEVLGSAGADLWALLSAVADRPAGEGAADDPGPVFARSATLARARGAREISLADLFLAMTEDPASPEAEALAISGLASGRLRRAVEAATLDAGAPSPAF